MPGMDLAVYRKALIEGGMKPDVVNELTEEALIRECKKRDIKIVEYLSGNANWGDFDCFERNALGASDIDTVLKNMKSFYNIGYQNAKINEMYENDEIPLEKFNELRSMYNENQAARLLVKQYLLKMKPEIIRVFMGTPDCDAILKELEKFKDFDSAMLLMGEPGVLEILDLKGYLQELEAEEEKNVTYGFFGKVPKFEIQFGPDPYGQISKIFPRFREYMNQES